MDVAIIDTEPQARFDNSGRGLSIQKTSTLDATRLLVSDSHELGLYVSVTSSARVQDLVVRGVVGAPVDLGAARGVQVQDSATLVGDRIVVEDVRGLGIVSSNGSTAELADVRATVVPRADCAESSCREAPYGYAASSEGSGLALTRFELSNAATCGVFVSDLILATAPTVDLVDGVISDSAIGACVQVPDYSLDRLTERVAYLRNEVNLDTTSLPVPEASNPLDVD
jgi:hypothetical protein